MSESIIQFCPAKVNLALSVGAVEASGYHPIASWMVPISLGDDLAITRLSRTEQTQFHLSWADDAPKPVSIDWPLEKDLAYRAYQAFQKEVDRDLPIRVDLKKRTPTGAGLGGGSSNAGSMLALLNRLYESPIRPDRLNAIAAELGADVPFFLDPRSAIVTGFGEIIEPIRESTRLWLVLIFPEFSCPTGPVYQAFDQLASSGHAVDLAVQRVRDLAHQPALPSDAPFNDLAEPAMRVEPRLRQLADAIHHQTGQPIHVSGSGSTLFIVSEHETDASHLAAALADDHVVRVVHTS